MADSCTGLITTFDFTYGDVDSIIDREIDKQGFRRAGEQSVALG
jgi:hypothetical protein